MKRLEILDYCRFIAVSFVVLFHYTFNGILNGKVESISYISEIVSVTKYGYLGVELFFIISGYVIFYSAQGRSARDFAISRMVRLYPLYWCGIIFTTMFAIWFGGELMKISLPQFLINLTMLQSYFNVADVDGVYWTLAYEVRFYFLVFLVLYFLPSRLTDVIIAWPILMPDSYTQIAV